MKTGARYSMQSFENINTYIYLRQSSKHLVERRAETQVPVGRFNRSMQMRPPLSSCDGCIMNRERTSIFETIKDASRPDARI